MQTFSDDTRNETHEVGDYGRDKTCQNGLKEAITGAGRVQSGETQRTTGVDVAGSLSLTGKVGHIYVQIHLFASVLHHRDRGPD